ncbi:hypothetical protein LJB86_01255, partial [Deltaproteobacteria bacterium OttesenSCG-928-M10]|nr:hypothetical protein [Deltaproteobacteria bacterium OttesenSCG-928-M10]
LLTPFYRLAAILPPLLLWTLIMSMVIGGGFMVFSGSIGGLMFTLALILAMLPLSYCLVFYFAETREFELAEAFTTPPEDSGRWHCALAVDHTGHVLRAPGALFGFIPAGKLRLLHDDPIVVRHGGGRLVRGDLLCGYFFRLHLPAVQSQGGP